MPFLFEVLSVQICSSAYHSCNECTPELLLPSHRLKVVVTLSQIHSRLFTHRTATYLIFSVFCPFSVNHRAVWESPSPSLVSEIVRPAHVVLCGIQSHLNDQYPQFEHHLYVTELLSCVWLIRYLW